MRAISWVAVSSVAQYEKESPDEQKRENERVAERIGARIVAVLEVDGHSREITEFVEAERLMPAYRQLRELLRAGAVDIVIARDMSRLGRTSALGQQFVNLCHENNCAVYLRSSPPTTLDAAEQRMSLGGQISYSIEGLFSQIELINLRKRYAFGMKARVESGRMPGKTPFGYRRTMEGEYEIDPVKGPVAQQALRAYLKGATINRMMTDYGLTESTATNMVRRPWTYAGYAQWKSRIHGLVRAPGQWRALITEAEANEIDIERERRARARRSVSPAVPFSGALVCYYCGSNMRSDGYGRADKAGWARKDRLYVCVNKSAGCRHTKIGENKLLWNMLLYANQRNVQKLAGVMDERLGKGRDGVKRVVESMQVAIVQLANQQDRLTRAYMEQIIEIEQFREQMAELKTRERKLKGELVLMQNQLDNVNEEGRSKRLDELLSLGLDSFFGRDETIWRRYVRVTIKNRDVHAINLMG